MPTTKRTPYVINFSVLPEDIKFEYLGAFLDHPTLIAYAIINKMALQRLLPEIKRRLPLLTPQLIVNRSHALLLIGSQLYLPTRDNQVRLFAQKEKLMPVKGLAGNLLQIKNGSQHILVHTTKELYGCGHNEFGELGLKDNEKRGEFTSITDVSGTIQQVIAGAHHTFIITSTGLYACGRNDYGQLGIGDKQARNEFTPVIGISGTVQQVITGFYHTFILTSTGLYACGRNDCGQLGLGDKQERLSLTLVKDVIIGTVQQIILGVNQTFIITSTGIYACGGNDYYQLGLSHKQEVLSLTPITNISGAPQQVISSLYHTFILTSVGLYACGRSSYGQLGFGHKETIPSLTLVPGIIGTIQQIAVSQTHTLILTSQGLYGCGRNNYGQLYPLKAAPQRSLTAMPGNVQQIAIIDENNSCILTDTHLYISEMGSNRKTLELETIYDKKTHQRFKQLARLWDSNESTPLTKQSSKFTL